MIKKTVKYTDFDGNEREESYFFHLTKADLLDMATSEDGSLVERIMAIAKEDDPIKIIPIIKQILIKAYGVKSDDGMRFVKKPEDVENFTYTEAFSELYMELSTNAEKAVEFFEGVIPQFDAETQKQIEDARKQWEKEQEEANKDKK